jgi:hypothetical protein
MLAERLQPSWFCSARFQSEELFTRFRMSVASAWPQVELFERVGKGLVEPHRAASRLRRPVNVAGERGPGRLEVLGDDERSCLEKRRHAAVDSECHHPSGAGATVQRPVKTQPFAAR